MAYLGIKAGELFHMVSNWLLWMGAHTCTTSRTSGAPWGSAGHRGLAFSFCSQNHLSKSESSKPTHGAQLSFGQMQTFLMTWSPKPFPKPSPEQRGVSSRQLCCAQRPPWGWKGCKVPASPHACGRPTKQLLGQLRSLLPAGCPRWASHCVF